MTIATRFHGISLIEWWRVIGDADHPAHVAYIIIYTRLSWFAASSFHGLVSHPRKRRCLGNRFVSFSPSARPTLGHPAILRSCGYTTNINLLILRRVNVKSLVSFIRPHRPVVSLLCTTLLPSLLYFLYTYFVKFLELNWIIPFPASWHDQRFLNPNDHSLRHFPSHLIYNGPRAVWLKIHAIISI